MAERGSIPTESDKPLPKEAEVLDRFEWGERPEARSAILFSLYGNQKAIRGKLAEIKSRRLDLSEDQLKRYNLATEACRDLGIDLISAATDISKERLPQPELIPVHRIWKTAALQAINLGPEGGKPDVRQVLHLTCSLKEYLTIPDQNHPQLKLVAERINFLTSILLEGKTATSDTPFSVAIPLGPSGAEELDKLFVHYPRLEKKLGSANGINRRELKRRIRRLPTPEEINVATAASVIWVKTAERGGVFSHGFGGNSQSSRNLVPLLARPAEMGQKFHDEVMVFPSLMGADNSLARDFPPPSPGGKTESIYPFTPAMEAEQLIFFLETTGLLKRFAVDGHLLTLAGHSMGGLATLLAGAEFAGTYGEALKLNLSSHDPCTPGSQTFVRGLEGTLVDVGVRLGRQMPAIVGTIAEPLNVHFNPFAKTAKIHGENLLDKKYGPATRHQRLGIEANEISEETVAKIRRAVRIYPTIIHLAEHSKMLDFKEQFATLRDKWKLPVLVQIIEEGDSDHFTQEAPKAKETIPLEGMLAELRPVQAIRLLDILRTARFTQPDGEKFHMLFPRQGLPNDHTWSYIKSDPTASPESLSTPEDAIDKSDLKTQLARDALFEPLLSSPEKFKVFYGRLKVAIIPLLTQTTFIGVKQNSANRG